jgi:hypothetical protein
VEVAVVKVVEVVDKEVEVVDKEVEVAVEKAGCSGCSCCSGVDVGAV